MTQGFDTSQLKAGMVPRERQSAEGNAALLVLVDSGGPYWERAIVEETVLVALEHFGMPYRVLDLATVPVTGEALAGSAGILMAQNRLNERMSGSACSAISEAVREGVGLVNLDFDLRAQKGPLQGIFGFDRVNPHPYATNSLRVRESGHYITEMQSPGEWHTFDRMVTAIAVEKWRDGVVPLADGILGKEQLIYIRHLAPGSAFEPRNFPLLFATKWGKGRAVQFALNVRVWRNGFYGHARGMDDLFWRSILWAVRKPFAANMVPPFVTMSFDDCEGRHDFTYAEIASRHGFVPMPSLFVRNVPERLYPKVRAGLESGAIRYNAHALGYYDLLIYNFGRGECSEAELESNFAEYDDLWRRVGTPPGKTLRFHWGEYGSKALPYLKARGGRYFCPALQTGLHKADMHMGDGFWPYNLQTCYYDYLPDDPAFFAFAAMLARHQEDFLTGSTVYLRDSEHNDIEQAASTAALQIKHGLRGGFYAEILTHEQKFDALSMDEWDRSLERAGEQTAGFEKEYTGHDEIGDYLKGKAGVRIERAEVSEGRMRCRFGGTTETPLRVSVYRDVDDGVAREYQALEPFEGSVEVG